MCKRRVLSKYDFCCKIKFMEYVCGQECFSCFDCGSNGEMTVQKNQIVTL